MMYWKESNEEFDIQTLSKQKLLIKDLIVIQMNLIPNRRFIIFTAVYELFIQHKHVFHFFDKTYSII